ncbi:MAG: helix-turn-helix transcriptional regulator, partial [Actinobacteria bacterium]|nr:helix-turn-helix transcriptional regulator [Actinomycetota bacterium]
VAFRMSRKPERGDVEGGLPRNYLRPCLLLLIAEQPSHGYDLLERLEELGMAATDPGGLYRMLRSMERDDLVDSEWETSSAGPARRVYTVTAEGMDWLHAWAGALREGRRLLSRFLERYESQVAADRGTAARA